MLILPSPRRLSRSPSVLVGSGRNCEGDRGSSVELEGETPLDSVELEVAVAPTQLMFELRRIGLRANLHANRVGGSRVQKADPIRRNRLRWCLSIATPTSPIEAVASRFPKRPHAHRSALSLSRNRHNLIEGADVPRDNRGQSPAGGRSVG